MSGHWAVTVERDGERIVTIESNCLSGREISDEDAETIRNAAWHLLAFIGDPAPADLLKVPRVLTDRMKQAYGEAVYYTTDTRLLPENIWRAMCAAAPTNFMPEREPTSADDVCPVCGALPGEQAKYMGIGPADDALLRKLADDAFVVMNWARKQGMKKDVQIEQAVAAFKKTLAAEESEEPN